MKLKITFLLILFAATIFLPTVAYAQTEPLPPKSLVSEVQSDDSVMLTWVSPMDTSVAGFNIYKKDITGKKDYVRINSKLLSETTYLDKGLKRGNDYIYMCRSVNTDGIESAASNSTSAPKMSMKTSAIVSHAGKTVRIAIPGDTIKYDIDFANQGFGVAKNVVIVYAIPKGTTFISGTARCSSYNVKLSYFDEKKKGWVEKVANEENISKVRFTVLEDVSPVAKDKNDTASLKVLVNY